MATGECGLKFKNESLLRERESYWLKVKALSLGLQEQK